LEILPENAYLKQERPYELAPFGGSEKGHFDEKVADE
jgi:hypothetical protein